MKQIKLGNTDEFISAIGLGCMGMSFAYGSSDDNESIKTLHKALDLGVTFWDTADMYGNGANEELLSKVLVQNREKVFIATKFGFRFKGGIGQLANANETYFDGSPKWMQTAVDESLRRLKIDTIDLYYAHRIDPNVPIEETVGAMAELVKAGKVRYLGLSEASVESIQKANAIHPIAALQSEYSLLSRDVEKEILPTLQKLGISFIPYSPLSRGLVTNKLELDKLENGDFRKSIPRNSGKALLNNQNLVADFAKLAASKSISPAQLALAWVIAQGDNIIPIPGTRNANRLEENAKAVNIKLDQQDILQISNLLAKYPNVGERYDEGGMRLVNNW